MYTDNSSSAFIRRMKSRTLVGARALNPGLVPGRNSDATGGFMTALDAGRRVEVVPELAEAVANLYSTVPDAPTGVTAVAGIRQAVVSFSAPLNDGRTPITEYTVISSPGGFTASGQASPITVTGLSNGTAYTFTVVATNKMGDSVPSEPSAAATTFTIPDAPRGVTATAGAGESIVSFMGPLSDGGTPITGYTVTSSPSGFTASGSASPITVTGLANGTAYTFTVVATNQMGNSVLSEPSSSITTFTVPSAPRNVTAVRGNEQATVSYNAPLSDGGSPITSYTITSSPDGIDASGTGLSTTITGLTNGRPYTFTVKANNVIGGSVPSAASAAVTPATVPDALTMISLTSSNEKLTARFSEPNNGGSPITGYKYSLDGGQTFSVNLLYPIGTISNRYLHIDNLTNYTSYDIVLRAVNSVGDGVPSNMLSGTPVASVPSAPTGVSAVPGDGQVTVSFIPANDGGSPITGYTVTSSPGGFTASGLASPITISGLSNGTAYTFRVTATNIAGTSPVSVASASVTPTGVPAAPTALSGVGGDKAIYVLFTAGNNGGSAITNYEYSIDGGETFIACSPAQTSSPIVIADPSLVNGTPYTVSLKAVNAAGAGPASATTSVTPTVNTMRDTNLVIDLDASNSSSYPGSGTTWTNLSSGGLYSGTLTGGPTFSNTNGGIITCDGTNDYIEIADAAAIRATVGGAITAQIWAKVDPSLTGGDGLISKQYWSPSYDGFSLSLNTNGSLYLKMNGTSVDGTYSSPTNSYAQGVWALYTIVVRFGGSSGNPSYVYVSPYRVASGNNAEMSIPSNTAPLRLAQGIQDSSYNLCPCDIGAFYYYNTALSQEDIIRNYDATKARFGL